MEGTDLADSQCFFDDCIEPATKTLPIALNGICRSLDLCVEHFHDIDWGVISEGELMEQIEGEFGSHGVA